MQRKKKGKREQKRKKTTTTKDRYDGKKFKKGKEKDSHKLS